MLTRDTPSDEQIIYICVRKATFLVFLSLVPFQSSLVFRMHDALVVDGAASAVITHPLSLRTSPFASQLMQQLHMLLHGVISDALAQNVTVHKQTQIHRPMSFYLRLSDVLIRRFTICCSVASQLWTSTTWIQRPDLRQHHGTGQT